MDGSTTLRYGCALIAALGLAACGGDGDDLDLPPPSEPLEVRIVSAYPALSFDQPVSFTTEPNNSDRAYVTTRAGVVYAFDNASSVDSRETFLDLRDRVDSSGGEMGLLGFTFDPGYAENGRVYVNYTGRSNPQQPNRHTQISSFRFTSGTAGTERGLLSFDQPFENHNGGWLGIGRDGKLYVASGDGGGAGDPQNNAQNLNSPLGKILRLEPEGGIPGDNPFAGQSGRRGEIWAYGLRNPYRASIDRETGELWVADVGQNALEEINVVTRGGNYGWRKFEGTQVYNRDDPDPGNTVAPVYEYDHANGRCSVTGGYVYRGNAIPALRGQYVFADFCSREVWSLVRDGASVRVTALGQVPGRPTSFGEDADGELYITAFDSRIYKIMPR